MPPGRSIVAISLVGTVACGSPPAARPASGVAQSPTSGVAQGPTSAASATAAPAAPAASSPVSTPVVVPPPKSEAAAPAATAHGRGSFPPPDAPPSRDASALPDDGHWTPFGDARLHEVAATDPPIIVRTVVHPHPKSRFVTVTVAAVDLARVAVRFVPGTEDLLWAHVPLGESSGLVPAEDQKRLVAVMNGGFQPKHGHWGMVDGETVVAPPRDEGCTLGIVADGSVALATFGRLPGAARNFRVLRQTPPCLLEDGAVHPDLLRGNDKRWAGHAADLTTRRRSAVGLDATGSILFYAIGEEADPRHLAEALRRVGATAAAELDINWYWTRFLLFGSASKRLEITSSLIPKMEHQPTSYVERPSTRDFFYFVLR